MLPQLVRNVLAPHKALQQQAGLAWSAAKQMTMQGAAGQQQQQQQRGIMSLNVPSLHLPSLAGLVDNQRDAAPQTQQPALPTLGNMFSRRSPLGFAASPLASTSRNLASLASQQSIRAVKGLGLGLGSRAGPTDAVQTRSYGTDGEIFSTAWLLTTDMMFWSGLIGGVVFRRNIIVLLLCTEIVMLACNMNFLFASAYLNDMTGVIMSITITTIAACETAIALALCVTYFHIRSAIDVEALNLLK